jgi:hypothetical protein
VVGALNRRDLGEAFGEITLDPHAPDRLAHTPLKPSTRTPQ